MNSAVKQMNTRHMNNVATKITSLLCALSVLIFALSSCSSSGTTSEKSFYISAAQRAVVLELDNDDYRFCSTGSYTISLNEDGSHTVRGFVDCRNDNGNKERRYFSVILTENSYEGAIVIWG